MAMATVRPDPPDNSTPPTTEELIEAFHDASITASMQDLQELIAAAETILQDVAGGSEE